ncbi:GSCOCG00008342001-RA-CDS [Cotesia congregata]|nr:GSCOCG00008342001-RA-CDS [Cotesia congregata]
MVYKFIFIISIILLIPRVRMPRIIVNLLNLFNKHFLKNIKLFYSYGIFLSITIIIIIIH